VTPNSDFKGTPLLNIEYLRNSTGERHSYSGMLIGTYTHTSLSGVILND